MRKSRISRAKQEKLVEHFVAGTTARCAASLVGVNFKTDAYYFQRLRLLIAQKTEQAASEAFCGEIEVDESYFGGTRKGNRGRGAAGKVPVFGLLKRGFMYLTAIMDWHSRKVLSWRLSNTLDARFCVEALEEALKTYGKPEIFNTDQGAQYTSEDFIKVLKNHEIKISMDGKGRWVDNVMIERLWRSVKQECVYLQEFDSIKELKNALQNWFGFYNEERPHATFDGRKPNDVYHNTITKLAA